MCNYFPIIWLFWPGKWFFFFSKNLVQRSDISVCCWTANIRTKLTIKNKNNNIKNGIFSALFILRSKWLWVSTKHCLFGCLCFIFHQHLSYSRLYSFPSVLVAAHWSPRQMDGTCSGQRWWLMGNGAIALRRFRNRFQMKQHGIMFLSPPRSHNRSVWTRCCVFCCPIKTLNTKVSYLQWGTWLFLLWSNWTCSASHFKYSLQTCPWACPCIWESSLPVCWLWANKDDSSKTLKLWRQFRRGFHSFKSLLCCPLSRSQRLHAHECVNRLTWQEGMWRIWLFFGDWDISWSSETIFPSLSK